MTIQPGLVINDRYQIVRQIGAGGMARVWLADDRLLGRKVAVKILSDRYAGDPDFVERFRREASAAASLSHPNIVAVFDRGEAEGSYYIVMEYLPGPDLKEIIREHERLAPRHAVDAALQILAALSAAHKRDVIHRDIKPQNVIVSEDGQLKVTDFGIARAGDDAGMTEVGSVIGTAQYLSPEQARGDDVTTASDCYSAGIVLYEMLTGRVPFDGDKPVAVAMRQVNEPPIAPRLLNADIPAELDAIVMTALEKRPGSRYRTAEEFSKALLAVRDRLPEPTGQQTQIMPPLEQGTSVLGPRTEATRVAPRPVPQQRPVPRQPVNVPPPPETGRRRGLLIGLAVILLLAIVGGVAALLIAGRDSTVGVPDVANQPRAQAVETLTAAGFTTSISERYDPAVTKGLVIETDPAGGTRAKEGAQIQVLVSQGPEMIALPDVTGKPFEDARGELIAAGFKVAEPKREESRDVAEGLVISQNPAAAEVPKGSTITLTVSSGVPQTTVPALSLLSQDEAEAKIADAGLKSAVVTRETNKRDPGLVVDQEPKANTTVDEGSTVTITISVAPPPPVDTTPAEPTPPPSSGGDTIPMPDVLSNTADDAIAKLQAQGFEIPIRSQTAGDNSAPEGTVVDTDPAPGTPVDPATQAVVIFVSDGSGAANPGNGNDNNGNGNGRGKRNNDRNDTPGRRP